MSSVWDMLRPAPLLIIPAMQISVFAVWMLTADPQSVPCYLCKIIPHLTADKTSTSILFRLIVMSSSPHSTQVEADKVKYVSVTSSPLNKSLYCSLWEIIFITIFLTLYLTQDQHKSWPLLTSKYIKGLHKKFSYINNIRLPE